MAEESPERFFCNRCGRSTRQTLLASHQQTFEPDDYEEMQIDFAQADWEIWQCCGCEEVTFKETWLTSEDRDFDGEVRPNVTFFPPRMQAWAKPKEFRRLPAHLEDLYEEVIQAFNGRSHLLCAGGLRALLEGVCVDQGVTKGPDKDGKMVKTLEGKINGLKGLDCVPASIVDHLHGFRFLGNTALHELGRPSATALAEAIEIIEDVLNVIYELNYKSARLYQRVKPSPKPDTSST